MHPYSPDIWTKSVPIPKIWYSKSVLFLLDCFAPPLPLMDKVQIKAAFLGESPLVEWEYWTYLFK